MNNVMKLDVCFTSDGLHGEVHPLHNHVVMEIVFCFLDFNSLTSARATSSLWKTPADPVLQKLTNIYIYWNTKSPEKPNVEEFRDYVRQVTPQRVFFRNYVLVDWQFYSEENEMEQFWIHCGHLIKHLNLIGFQSRFLMCWIRNAFFKYTPNLEFIHLYASKPYVRISWDESMTEKEDGIGSSSSDSETDSEQEQDTDEEPMGEMDLKEISSPNLKLCTLSIHMFEKFKFPLSWKQVIESYPNLKTLSLKIVFDEDFERIISKVLHALTEIATEDPDKLMLEELDIFRWIDEPVPIADVHYETATKLGLKLKRISLAVDQHTILTPFVVGNFISKHRNTLSYLSLEVEHTHFPIFPPLVRVPETVTYPRLTTLIMDISALNVNHVDFLDEINCLKTLTIQDYQAKDKTMSRSQLISNTLTLITHTSLTSLNLMANVLTFDCIQKIPNLFPNLIKFSAILKEPLLIKVFALMQNLEELTVVGYDITDFGLTGISTSAHQTRTGEQECTVHVGIRQMKKLRRFSLQTELSQFTEERNRSNLDLTDDIVQNGFVYLTEMRNLELPKTLMTKTGLAELFKQTNIVTVSHHYVPIQWVGSEERLTVPAITHNCDCVSGLLWMETLSL